MSFSEFSSLDPHPRQRRRILDAEMSYVDIGHGDPTVFLHGNPTSSYLWRNVIPFVSGRSRCLAPDLIGMGRSSPSPLRGPRFADHVRYLDAWFDELNLDRVVLVVHDWGSALGFDWARRHPDPWSGSLTWRRLCSRDGDDFPDGRDVMFRALRSDRGEGMVLDDNFFIETILPKSVIQPLGDAEMEAYRGPFRSRESRWPMLMFPRELPIEGEPADVVKTVEEYGQWMASNDIPKLFISAHPGALLVGRAREFCRTWRNQQEVTVKGIHYVQEDSPIEIGQALESFVAAVRAEQRR